MATYYRSGIGHSLMDAYTDNGASSGAAPLGDNLLYVKAKEFAISNADGSVTYVSGRGFTFDSTTGEFTSGLITLIRHYDASGKYIDDIKDFESPLSAAAFQAQLEATAGSGSAGLAQFLFSGDDHLNAFYYKGTDTGVSLNGYAGNDLIHGSTLDDTISGGNGADTIFGNRGGDLVFGNAGNDEIRGGAGDDALYGDSLIPAQVIGNDWISGGAGNDFIDGGLGNDRITGNAGNDRLTGGWGGNDRLRGGDGADTFVFSFSIDDIRPVGGTWGNDIVADFEVGVDDLVLIDLLSRPVTYENNADGNAVIRVDEFNSVTLFGIDANSVALSDLFL